MMKNHLSLSFVVAQMVIVATFSSIAFGQDSADWREALRENLYQTHQREMEELGHDPVKFLELNVQEIASVLKTPEIKKGTRVGHLTQTQANEMIRYARFHPVVGRLAKAKYDPEGNRGFCFGRATFLHLELLRRGVQKEAIRKVFLVGPMQTGEIIWQFHVATVVRGTKGEWFVLDPNFDKAPTLDDWFLYHLKLSTDRNLRAFVTHPNKIGPDAWGYNIAEGGLMDPFYNDYFKNMFESFKEPPLVSYKRKAKSCSRAHSAAPALKQSSAE